MQRVALAVAYDGTRFDSYARQPGKRTTEGELVRLLSEAGALTEAQSGRFRSGSRTDRGVSAAWNVVAFDTPFRPPAVAALDARAPEGLHLVSAVAVSDGFDPRRARRRVYRYHLDRALAWDRVAPTAERFVGRRDHSNFRRADGAKSPVARIERVSYRAGPPGPRIEVAAPAFLWHQVRRIVAALVAVEEGRVAHGDVVRALDEPGRRVDFGLAPAENVLLWRVDYAGVAFPPATPAVRRRLARERARARRRGAWLEAAMRGSGPRVRR